jgi:hypothetical protein
VMEISSTEIKYKKADNMDGPDYVTDKNDVRSIRFKNGSVDSFPEIKPWLKPIKRDQERTEKIPFENYTKKFKIETSGKYYFMDNKTYSESDILSIIKNEKNSSISEHIHKARVAHVLQPVCFIGMPAVTAGFIMLADSQGTFFTPQNTKVQNNGIALISVGAACLVSAIILKVYRHVHTKRAVELYNQEY